jgi:hypothetical protein
MLKRLATVTLLLLVSGTLLRADEASPAARARGFRPLWTAVGAGGGFALGVWGGLTWFDDAINSDRKVWTTAIVSAAAGGILGYLIDRHQARRANPSATPAERFDGRTWRRDVFGAAAPRGSLRPPDVGTLIGLGRSQGTAAAPSQ